jgi:predicted nucleic acid-binding protein
MNRYLLDANHLSVAIRRPSGLRDRIRDRARLGDRFGTCVPALCELEAGLRQLHSRHGHNKRLANLLKIVRKWPTDDSLVERFGEFHMLSRPEAAHFLSSIYCWPQWLGN